MKKILFAAAILAGTLVAQAQWTNPYQNNPAADQLAQQQREAQQAHERQMEELRRQAEAQAAAEAARRAACTRTTYHKDMWGNTVATTVPCYNF